MATLFPLTSEDSILHKDYFTDADMLDIFDGTESDYSSDVLEKEPQKETVFSDCSSSTSEEEVIEKKPVSFKISGKAPRPLTLTQANLMVANSTTNTTNSEDEDDEEEEEEEEGRIVHIHHQLLGPAAKKSPFYQRRTREEKTRLMEFLTRAHEIENSRRAYMKEWSDLLLSMLSLKQSVLELGSPLPEPEPVPVKNLLDGFNTHLLNYNLLTPLLFQNQLKVSSLKEDNFQCFQMSTPLSTIIFIRVRV